VEPSNDVPYAHEMRAGDRYAPLRFRISREINEQYLFALGDYAPRYTGGGRTPAHVHPALLLHMSARTRSPSFRLAPGMGSVFARDRVTFHRPALVDEWLHVQWTIREVYERKARIYQALDTRVLDDRGDLVIDRDAHSVFFTGSS
jgi:acyl dehydratase